MIRITEISIFATANSSTNTCRYIQGPRRRVTFVHRLNSSYFNCRIIILNYSAPRLIYIVVALIFNHCSVNFIIHRTITIESKISIFTLLYFCKYWKRYFRIKWIKYLMHQIVYKFLLYAEWIAANNSFGIIHLTILMSDIMAIITLKRKYRIN